jgi:hypothetical protein
LKRWRRRAAALVLLGALAHVVFWYAPRERAGTPALDEARWLLGDRAWTTALWIPFPHQNLAALERRVGDVDAWLASLAEAAGTRALQLPRFGPWSAPPSRELAVAVREDGALRAVARVYPAVAAVARLAGFLAGNPWLAGGEVPLGGGRTGRVAWRGRVWSVASLDAPAVEESRGLDGANAGPALVRVRLERPPAPLPGGLWVVRREADRTLVARTGEPGPPLAAGPAESGIEPPAAWVAEAGAGGGPSALVLWTSGGPVEGFPRAATLDPPGEARFSLPGASLARVAGLDPASRETAGTTVRAYDERSLEEGVRLAPWLAARLPGAGLAGPWRSFAAGADPGRTAEALERAVRHLRRIPLLGAREAGRLAAAAGLLAPWAGCGELRVEVWRQPDGARAALCAPPAGRRSR